MMTLGGPARRAWSGAVEISLAAPGMLRLGEDFGEGVGETAAALAGLESDSNGLSSSLHARTKSEAVSTVATKSSRESLP